MAVRTPARAVTRRRLFGGVGKNEREFLAASGSQLWADLADCLSVGRCHRASLPPARLCAAVVELDLTKGSAEKSAVRLIDAYEGQCPNDGMDVECHPETWTLSKNIRMYTTFRSVWVIRLRASPFDRVGYGGCCHTFAWP